MIVAHNDAERAATSTATAAARIPEEIQRIVRETKAQVGISHDGDADRVLLCDENGELVDGDEIMAIAALDFLSAAGSRRTRSSPRS